MKNHIKTIGLMTLLVFSASLSVAAADFNDNQDTLVDARVVEVSEQRISVVAQTGVEHVIAVDETNTKVKKGDSEVSMKDLRIGDVITIELEVGSRIKLAKQIEISRPRDVEVARIPE
ncbi:MAG: hypothetical protein H0T45_17045 [Pyrinomonadaceae bacterium]|nr:hypothetical protein [Pyrinomonadaceae bacterium]